MKSTTRPRAIVAACLLLATAWARGGSPEQPGRPAPPAAPAGPMGPIQGLGSQDRKELYHLPEGIELVPLAWIKALKSIKMGRPFLEMPQRFGLIPDPDSPNALPIGITAAPSRGAEFLGPMVGVNCAACHVGGLTFRGRLFPLLGGPNLFDLNAFYEELIGSLTVTFLDEELRGEFRQALVEQGDTNSVVLAQQGFAAAVAASLLGPGDLKATAQLFQNRLLAAVKPITTIAEARMVAAALVAAAKAQPGRAPAPDPAALAKLQSAVSAVVAQLAQTDVLGLVSLVIAPEYPDDPVKAAAKQADPVLAGVLAALQVELSLLKSRLTFIAKLKALHEAQRPMPGPGRIDAFGGIRFLVFPTSDAIPADSPVSYPTLWMVNQTYWLHWDGNTNSVIQRNIGQALGQGAPFEPYGVGDYHSKVQPENIHTLETIVRRIAPPDWPAMLFGPIDPVKAARGKATYQGRCDKCHVVAPRDGDKIGKLLEAAKAWAVGGKKGPRPADPREEDLLEKLYSIDEIGTDPTRAMNFATSVGRGRQPFSTGGNEFAEALKVAAGTYSERSYDDNGIVGAARAKFDWPSEMVRWQTTRKYVARPLVSIWATAPYLHNGSVPTLYDLLLPAKDRPKLFFVGQREYDPERLGYVVDPKKIPPDQVPILFPFNATAGGNLNTGHEGHDYGTDLDDAGRKDLLEYLKTL
jgi:mono/diheme cytochrome c family protein